MKINSSEWEFDGAKWLDCTTSDDTLRGVRFNRKRPATGLIERNLEVTTVGIDIPSHRSHIDYPRRRVLSLEEVTSDEKSTLAGVMHHRADRWSFGRAAQRCRTLNCFRQSPGSGNTRGSKSPGASQSDGAGGRLAAKEYPIKFRTLTAGTIKSIRIRYFNKKTWASEKDARDYVAGFLSNKASEVFGFQVWSQSVGVPEIECFVEFTDEHRKKLLAEKKGCREGRLLIWNTESCFRDATGRWYFVSAFDQFHRAHPKGNRELVNRAKSK